MARPKKGEGKTKDAAVLQVSVEDFVRTRDSVVTGLATLQSAVQDLSRAYIAHTNTVLGRAPGSGVELLTSAAFSANPLGEAGLITHRIASEGVKDETADGKKKKKRAHDPNAPKRPLTPYFLYMQSARSVIASDLGQGAKPGDISSEGTRRWKAMPENEKHLWKVAYENNLPDYRSRMAAYKAGQGGADPAAAQLAAENGAIAEDVDMGAGEVQEVASASKPADTPKSAKRRKSAKDGEASKATGDAASGKVTSVAPPSVKQTAVPPPSASAKEAEKDKSAEKKRKSGGRKSKKDEASKEDAAESAAKGDGKRSTKRKRKSEAGEEA